MKKYKLGDVASVQISNVDKKTQKHEIPVRLCNFTDVYYNWAITSSVEDDFLTASANTKEIERFSLQKGQVALTKDSETRYDIGISAYISEDFDDVLLGYHCALITPNESKVNGQYLNAFMHSRYIRKYFENCASGSGQRFSLTIQVLEDIPLLLPSIEEQRYIGQVFSDIDRKITLNRAINHNLEAMAKQLYDYWFVQFDFPDENGRPYKSSGGKMVWNEKLKRDIPETWKDSQLNKWLQIQSGYAFKSDSYLSEGVYKIITIKNVQEYRLDTSNCDYINSLPSDVKDSCILKVGDRLISLTGNCGRLCIVSETNLLLNQRVGVMICEETMKDFFYRLLGSNEFQSLCAYLANGAAQSNLSPIDLCKLTFPLPPRDILESFQCQASKITQLFILKEKEISLLSKQRDELLPLLMNGQVSVNYDLSHN